jgi:hypothetical protein
LELVYFYVQNQVGRIKLPQMKRFIFVFTAALLALPAVSQVKQEVIASAGGYNVTANISISWTLGETIVPTFTTPNLILTHGFQAVLKTVIVEENIEDKVTVTVYPNPTSENVNIAFEEPVDGEIKIFLLNNTGMLVKTDFIEAAMQEKQISMQDLPAGIYYIKLIKGKLSNVYKVVKL